MAPVNNYLHCIVSSVLLFSLVSPSQADIYKYVDKYGRVTLTDEPDNSNYKKLVKTWKGWEEAKSQIAIKDFAKNKERHAVISAESAYDTNAISRAGAVGLMQLMPETAKRYGVVNRRNPVDNVDGGARYLRDLLAMFKNDLQLTLAAYNAGEGAVKKYGNKIPPYDETRNYIKKVINFYKKYRDSGV
jgi:hypothetical protein